jgi:hypothetical protein
VPSKRRLERLEKEKNGCLTKIEMPRREIATKIRSRLDILKRDRVKIVLV